MYTNGIYTVKHVDAITRSSWICTLVVDNFTTTGEGYTPRGAMSAANRAMAKKQRFYFKLKEQRDVIEDLLADTVVKQFVDKIVEKAQDAS